MREQGSALTAEAYRNKMKTVLKEGIMSREGGSWIRWLAVIVIIVLTIIGVVYIFIHLGIALMFGLIAAALAIILVMFGRNR